MAAQDWAEFRAYLKDLLQDANVRKLIEHRADISTRTLARWINGETDEPDRKRLAALLQALPHYRDQLLGVISKAIPDFDVPLIDNTRNTLEDIPTTFWIRLFETHASTPRNLHFTSIVNMIFLQLQPYVDVERDGTVLCVSQCVPPRTPDGPVRSLREITKRTTYRPTLERARGYFFLGNESLAGHTAATGLANVVQDLSQEKQLPLRTVQNIGSIATYPIQRSGYIAGCFSVGSPRTNAFPPRLQYHLQIYSYFLSLAFDSDQFYPPERIFLRNMPEDHIQEHHQQNFQKRVLDILNEHSDINRSQAEIQVWQQIEEELINAIAQDNTFPV